MINRKKCFSEFVRLWGPVILYMALIFLLSSMSFNFSLFQNAQKNHIDWLVHVVEYSVLGYLLARAVAHLGLGRRRWVIVITLGFLYALTDEWHQSYVPGRDASFYDVAADLTGIAIGLWTWIKKERYA